MLATLPGGAQALLPGSGGVCWSLQECMFESLSLLQAWRKQGKRGIWLRVPTERSAYIEPAVAAGFLFHHAEPSYVMCTHWLSVDPNKLPPNASHQVAA